VAVARSPIGDGVYDNQAKQRFHLYRSRSIFPLGRLTGAVSNSAKRPDTYKPAIGLVKMK
jgi:hypothetical protein